MSAVYGRLHFKVVVVGGAHISGFKVGSSSFLDPELEPTAGVALSEVAPTREAAAGKDSHSAGEPLLAGDSDSGSAVKSTYVGRDDAACQCSTCP